jgi:hypothetical protein
MAGAVVVSGDGPPPQFENGVLLPNIQRAEN